MAAAFDPRTSTRSEWKIWQGREAATLRAVGPIGTYTDHALAVSAETAVAKFRAVQWKEMAASAGVYTSQDQVVLVPDEALPTGVKPKAGDLVYRPFDATTLTVLEVTVGKFGNTHKCVARNLVLVSGLRSLGTLLRPGETADAAGKRVPNLAAAFSDVPCRVQRTAGENAGQQFDSPSINVRATAYLGQQIIAQFGDVFVVGSERYTVTGWRDPDRIDQLMTLDLEQL